MQHYPFVVDETPHCLWDQDITSHNLAFLDSIDPGYFRHVAGISGPLLTGPERQYAALVLRTAYSHGLETLFALLGAAVQAPHCAVGWMLKYGNEELRSLTRKIDDWQSVRSRLTIEPVTWETLAATVNDFRTDDVEKDRRRAEAFGRLWRRFAHEFLDGMREREYNNVKHGLRTRSGGFRLAIGIEAIPGVPAAPETMVPMGGSEFGSSFYVPEQLARRNFRIKRHSLNWEAANLVSALGLISVSIGNVVAFLKMVGGADPAGIRIACPDDEGEFEEPWKLVTGVTSINMNPAITEQDIQPLSKEDILASYDAGASPGPGDD